MENLKKKQTPNTNFRYNILNLLIYIIGIVLIATLFSLQIVNGSTYRETSNTRLARESTLYASRSNIVDRNLSTLATSEMTFEIAMYKTKLDNDTLNKTILEVINTLEENGDEYKDIFPVDIEPLKFSFSSEEKKKNWLKKYNLEEDTEPEKVLEFFKDKYDIKEENIKDIRKIIAVRYRISTEGYSSTKKLTIAENISRKSAITFEEQGEKYLGIEVITNAKRKYPNGSLCSHILRLYKFYNRRSIQKE